MFNEHHARAGSGRLIRAGDNGVVRAQRLRRPGAVARVGLAVAALLAAGWPSTSQAAPVVATLRSHLLSAADLSAGWSVAPMTSTQGQQVTTSPCGDTVVALLSPPGLATSLIGPTYGTASFAEGVSRVPSLREALASGPQAEAAWQQVSRALASCRTATFVSGGLKVVGTGGLLALARLGRGSSAYAWTFSTAGVVRTWADLILFQTAGYYGYLSYTDLGLPQVSTVTAFAQAAVAKASNGATAPVPDTVSIASAPVLTVPTTRGTVAYRAIGNGSPLVMISGYSGRMEDWDRRLVDALAQSHRVVIFDNAGVGRTQSLRAPLTIDALANQTAAFIDALHLGRPDVLGWSMGTAIVQALAVLHPSEVRALVLCAPYPGNGAVVLPSSKVLDAQNDPTALFPANQVSAEVSYNLVVASYPKAPPASTATDSAQLNALHQWWAGGDPAGRLVATIAVPTLLADGTADRLDPVANSHLLARLIPGATLTLYPDAGHAFLFQDYTAFAALVTSFLSQATSH